jgi:hypothetical protein
MAKFTFHNRCQTAMRFSNINGIPIEVNGFGQQAFNDPISEPTTVTNNYYGDGAEQQANNNDDNSNVFQTSNDTDSFQDAAGDSDWT